MICRRQGWILLAVLLLPGIALEGAAVSVELSSPAGEVRECDPEPLRISISVRNPGAIAIAGLQMFLRYPAEYFEPESWEKGDLKGLVAVNGPAPFGRGFHGCDARPEDPWDDGLGVDVVSVIASAWSEDGSTQEVRAVQATLGAFAFRLRSGAVLSADPVAFSLEADSCSPVLSGGCAFFDSAGAIIEASFVKPSTAVRVVPGIQVRSFACAKNGGGPGVVLSWLLPIDGAAGLLLNVYRNGSLIGRGLPVQLASLEDAAAPADFLRYEAVLVRKNVEEACRASCQIDLSVGGRQFIRGDVNDDGRMNLSDVVGLLGYLFLGNEISCKDSGDVDDTGILENTDAIYALGFLFLGSVQPPPPFPQRGVDPTQDALDC